MPRQAFSSVPPRQADPERIPSCSTALQCHRSLGFSFFQRHAGADAFSVSCWWKAPPVSFSIIHLQHTMAGNHCVTILNFPAHQVDKSGFSPRPGTSFTELAHWLASEKLGSRCGQTFVQIGGNFSSQANGCLSAIVGLDCLSCLLLFSGQFDLSATSSAGEALRSIFSFLG